MGAATSILTVRRQNKDPNGHVAFDEVLWPDAGGDLRHHVRQWDTRGAAASPADRPWLLDPLALNDKADGRYRLLTVTLRAYGHLDDARYDGDLVPSNKTDGTGERHFVVPKAAGGFVSVAAGWLAG